MVLLIDDTAKHWNTPVFQRRALGDPLSAEDGQMLSLETKLKIGSALSTKTT